MQYEERPELATAQAMIAARNGEALCAVPFLSTFVGYDGNIYLCCSDWKKEAVVSTVFDDPGQYIGPKLGYVAGREPVCKTCNLDPLNALVDELKATNLGLPDAKDPSQAGRRLRLLRAPAAGGHRRRLRRRLLHPVGPPPHPRPPGLIVGRPEAGPRRRVRLTRRPQPPADPRRR